MSWFDDLSEESWFRSQNPGHLVEIMAERAGSPRKARLALVACCRLAWPGLLPRPHPLDAGCAALLDLCERFADGAAKFPQLADARNALAGPSVPRGGPEDRKVAAVWFTSGRDPVKSAGEAVHRLLGISWGGLTLPDRPPEHRYAPGRWSAVCLGFVGVIRDVFGNPFRPTAFDPRWRTSTAVGLAGRMYEERDFAGLPILGDALEDAGCDGPDILAHCRGDGPHVRGCWVVDLVLNRS